MLTYQIHTIELAPEKSQPLLELFTEAVRFVPNLAGAIANSPVLAKSLLGLFQNVHSGSFTEAEVQVQLFTNAVTNSSSWPVAFHTALALKQGLDPADVQAIRERRSPEQQRYAEPSRLAKTLIENRGQVSDDDFDTFLKAGFEKEARAGGRWSDRSIDHTRTMQAKSRIRHWRHSWKSTPGVGSLA